MSKKRDQLKVIYDILFAIQESNGEIKPTRLLYSSNLSHQMMEEYLTELIGKKFIMQNQKKKGITYSLTQKGYDYINKYKQIIDFIKTFGLSE